MYAVVITEPGGPEVLAWTEVPEPVPGPGEVVIDIVASAVNRADLLQRAGFYDPPPGTSPYPGLECSGRISAIGPPADPSPAPGSDLPAWQLGDEVCALLTGGGYAQRVAVPAGQVLPVPAGVSLRDAAGLPEVAGTVWSNLIGVARLEPGETLLVHGGGSGIGTFAVQFATALGATVIATARSAKHATLRDLGASTVIDYTSTDFVTEVQRVTDGRGADVILDIMGASYLERNIRALAAGGRLVVIGLQGGRTAELDLGLLMAKRASVASTALRSRPAAQKAQIVRGVRDQVWPLLASGRVRPVIDRAVPMSAAAQAHAAVAAGDTLGKVLLLPDH